MTPFARQAAPVALAAALEASELVMRVYAAPFDVDYKAKDDPVTRADRESNALICERLLHEFPGIPVVAEESDPATYAGFEGSDRAWFVDPVDGTREFVARNGEFAVMIGLAERGRATLGIIVAPAWGRTFVGVVGDGAYELSTDGTRTPIHVSPRASVDGAKVAVSRSRASTHVAALVASMGGCSLSPHGSSGLKAVLVAVGSHDVYLQPGRAGMRWDACASEGLVLAAGGRCSQADGAPIDYRSPDLVNSRGFVASNGHLHDAVLRALRERGADGTS